MLIADLGETKAKMWQPPAVRPATKTERVLTREELQKLSRELSLLSPFAVRDAYLKAHHACCLASGLPSPRAVQELVAVWKVLRKWR
jgi:hypothetical protein